MKIADYFKEDNVNKALQAYTIFYQQNHWPVENKYQLYKAGNIAFGQDQTNENNKKEKFDIIYNDLKSNWQVFRNAESCWDSRKIFRVLTECNECSRESNLTLIDINPEQHTGFLIKCLRKIKKIKTTRSGKISIMAISKFLHFFNPTLFPIYDGAIIENKVLKTFDKDWKKTTISTTESMDSELRKYLRYISFANLCIKENSTNIMKIFGNWFNEQIREENNFLDINNYYATAFEFIAIGASILEECRIYNIQ